MDQEKFTKLNQPSNPNMPRDTVETLKQIQKQGLSISLVGSTSPSFCLPQQAAVDRSKQSVQATEKVSKASPRPQSTPENKPQIIPARLASAPVSTRLASQTTFHDSKTPASQGRPNQGTVPESKGFNQGWSSSNASSDNKPQGNANRTIQTPTSSKIPNTQARLGQLLLSEPAIPVSRNSPVILPENKAQARTVGQRVAPNQQIIEGKMQSSQERLNVNLSSPPEAKVFSNQARTSHSFVVTHDGKTTAAAQRVVTQKAAEVKVGNQITTNKQIEMKTTPVNRVIPNVKTLPDATQAKSRQNFVKAEAKSSISSTSALMVEGKMSNSPRVVNSISDNNTPRGNPGKISQAQLRLHQNILAAAEVAIPVHGKLVQAQVENKVILPGEMTPDGSVAASLTAVRGTVSKRPASVCSPAKKRCIKRTPNAESNNLNPEDRNENGDQLFNTLKSRTPGLTITPVRPTATIVSTPTSNSSGVSRISADLIDKEYTHTQCPSCNNYSLNPKWCQVCKCSLTPGVQTTQHNTEIAQKMSASSLIVTKNVTNVMVSKQIIINPSDALVQGQSIQFGQTVQQKKIYIKTGSMIQSAARSKASRTRVRRKYVEPVCLTLSSDDEEEHMQGHFNPFADDTLSNQSQMFPPESEGSKSDQDDENGESDDQFPGVTNIMPNDKMAYEEEDEEEEEEEEKELGMGMGDLEMEEESFEEEGEEDICGSEVDEEEEEEVPPEEEDEEQLMSKGPIDGISSIEDPLRCRSVRIGSFKVHPKSNSTYLYIYLAMDGISFTAPMVNDPSKVINITLKPTDITNMLFHFGRCLPIIFLFTTPSFAEAIRKSLNMSSGDYAYFDPTSNDEKQKKITFLIDSITDEQRRFLRQNFPVENLLELDQKSANEILVKSTPNQNHVVKCEVAQPFQISSENQLSVTPVQPSLAMKLAAVPAIPQPVTKLFTYPPPPQTGGIAITNEDVACLNEGEFLNDAIIDFYLKYIFYEKLSEYHREKTHIFSSYFFPRLTHKPERTRPGLDEGQKTVQMRRHSQVKTWTRHVDIFSKDFIIIPVNQNVHWFLAIICYPGLVPEASESPVKSDSKNVKSSDNVTSTDDQEENKTPKEPNSTVEGVSQNVDENSSASNNSMFESEEPDSEEPMLPEAPDSSTHPDKNRRRKEAPCICIFDSLNGPNRWRIASMLREYLEIEWKMRKGTRKVFDKNTMQGYIMQCPQQTNYSDCGIYVLQYVESFFENPLPYFDSPIPNLSEWFPKEKVAKKRQELKELILNLQKKYPAQSASNFRKTNVSENVPPSPSKVLQPTDNR